MAEGLRPFDMDGVLKDLPSWLDFSINLMDSLAIEDQKKTETHSFMSSYTLNKVSTNIQRTQESLEMKLEEGANSLKEVNDDMLDSKKEMIGTGRRLMINLEELDQADAQEKYIQQQENKCHRNLQEMEKLVERKRSQNSWFTRLFTNVLDDSHTEALNSYSDLKDFASKTRTRHENTRKKKWNVMQDIGGSVDNISCHLMIQSLMGLGKHQLKERLCLISSQCENLRSLRVKLDPLTGCFHVLKEICLYFDSWQSVDLNLIQPILNQLDMRVEDLFPCVKDSDRQKLQILKAKVVRLNRPASSLDFEDDLFRSNYLTENEDDHNFCLVVPSNQEQFPSMQQWMRNLETLSEFDTDFSLSESLPGGGFKHLQHATSFKACIHKLRNEWWNCMFKVRNSFLMYQLYTTLIAVCLLQANKTLQKASIQRNTAILLQQYILGMRNIATEVEATFISLIGMLKELTLSRTVADGKTAEAFKELGIKEKMNSKMSTETQRDIRNTEQQWKKLSETVDEKWEMFSKVIADHPGAFKLMTTTAVNQCMSVFYGVASFFRKTSEKVQNFDIHGTLSTIKSEMSHLRSKFSRGSKEDSDDLCCEMITLLQLREIKEATGVIIHVLECQQDSQNLEDLAWETHASIEARMRSVKKTEEYAELDRIISNILKACETVQKESKRWNSSHDTSIKELNQARKSLDVMIETVDKRIKSTEEEKTKSMVISEDDIPKYKSGDLQRTAVRRMATKQDLSSAWDEFDRKTEAMALLFEAQKKTEPLLGQQKFQLKELEETLRLMSKASLELSNLQKHSQVVRGFVQEASHAIKVTLSSKIDHLIENLEVSFKRRYGRISTYQQETLQNDIRDVGRTAKKIHEYSTNFLTHCDI